MTQIFKKCTKCGNILTIYSGNQNTICETCFEVFDTNSLLDQEDKTFFKSFDSGELEENLKYNALIMQGNEHIANEQYKNAEKSYKQAISLNENRYEGFYGVARAKTHNFQIIPESLDYIEYAKIAINLADDDIDPQINANLAKLGIAKNK